MTTLAPARTRLKWAHRRCRVCGAHIASDSEAIQVTRKRSWRDAPRLVFWLCKRHGEDLISAVERLSKEAV